MPGSSSTTIQVPEALIYEMDEGTPIYYRGYREVLSGAKTTEQVMGSGILQAVLIELIKDFLKPLFGKDCVIRFPSPPIIHPASNPSDSDVPSAGPVS